MQGFRQLLRESRIARFMLAIGMIVPVMATLSIVLENRALGGWAVLAWLPLTLVVAAAGLYAHVRDDILPKHSPEASEETPGE
jgi:hypothetical protein